MSNLPERINVMKVVSYDVSKLVDEIKELQINGMWSDPGSEITVSDLIEYIDEAVQTSFSCGHGHVTDITDLIYQDENGEEL